MHHAEKGFTLIELVVVITILGILAAVALPRFAALQTDARVARIQGALGAIKSGAVMAHAAALTGGATMSGAATVTLEGTTINLVNGYPSVNDIDEAAGITFGTTTDAFADGGVAGTVRTIAVDSTHATCSITYTQAVAGAAPTYGAVTAANCS